MPVSDPCALDGATALDQLSQRLYVSLKRQDEYQGPLENSKDDARPRVGRDLWGSRRRRILYRNPSTSSSPQGISSHLVFLLETCVLGRTC